MIKDLINFCFQLKSNLEPDEVEKSFYNRIFYFPFRTKTNFTKKGLDHMDHMIRYKLLPTLLQMEGRREKSKVELDLLDDIREIFLKINMV